MITDSILRVEPMLERVSRRYTIPSLDGLRAISIGFVLLSHASLMSGFPSVLRPVSHYGLFGVKVFFTISGYLITTLLLRERDKSGTINLGRFYLRRTFRIFPPYYVFLGVVAAAGSAKLLQTSGTAWWPAVTYTSNIFKTNSWFIGHSWSLSMEEQFYLCWPLLIMLLNRIAALVVTLGFVLISPLVRVFIYLLTHNPRYVGMVAFDAIAIGCALALAAPYLMRQQVWLRIMKSPWFFVVPLAALTTHYTFSGTMRWQWAFDIAVGQTVVAAAIGICLCWCLTHSTGLVFRFLNSSFLRAIGVSSYSIYLWQEIFLWAGSRLPITVALVEVFVAALASFWLIERPALWLRSKIEKRIY